MLLRTIEVRNYLSVEHAKLDDLGTLNLLVGRNNAGKSSFFRVLATLARVIQGGGLLQNQPWPVTILTDHRKDATLEVRLAFELRPADRRDFINRLPKIESAVSTRLFDSPFFRHAEFYFRSAVGLPEYLHLREIRARAEDGSWAVTQQMKQHDNEFTNDISHTATSFGSVIAKYGQMRLDAKYIGISADVGCDVQIKSHVLLADFFPGDPTAAWLQHRVARYLTEAFFFNPFRHCLGRPPSREAPRLDQDGGNLAQAVDTIIRRSSRQAKRIETFVHAAVPGLGTLQTPPRGTDTEIGFQSPDDTFFTHLHDMGGGVEQLLMVATALETTGSTSTLFLEEPESHLHPSAQRFLLDQVSRGERQVFLTTHSPVLLNAARGATVHLVQLTDRRTTATKVRDATALGGLLSDIGARNSDVLLSNAVLFVEGPGDRDALSAWAETLGTPLPEAGVTVLTTAGGEHADHHAPVRSDVLEGISEGSPVPHLFLLDRDGRGDAEVHRLTGSLKDRCHILSAWEIENYLLVPRALLVAMREKCRDGGGNAVAERASESKVGSAIADVAAELYELALLKRVRAEIPGLRGGLLTREMIAELIPNTNDPRLGEIIRARLSERVGGHVAGLNLDDMIAGHRKALDAAWSDPTERLQVVPGEEVVSGVFKRFDATYAKPKDTARIARAMTREEIAPEIQSLVSRVVNMAGGRSVPIPT